MGNRCNLSKKRSPRVSKLDNTTNSAQANKDKYLTRYSLLIPNQVRQCEQVWQRHGYDHVIGSHLMDDLHHKKEYYNNSFAPVK